MGLISKTQHSWKGAGPQARGIYSIVLTFITPIIVIICYDYDYDYDYDYYFYYQCFYCNRSSVIVSGVRFF